VDATSPDGAVVDYVATATSANGEPAPITCQPASGTTFPIGDTTVACSATDATGTSQGAFSVHVQGSDEQLADLKAASTGVGSGQSLVSKVEEAEAALANDDLNGACNTLRHSYPNAVIAQSGKKIPIALADELIADANQIADVLTCSTELGSPVAIVLMVPLGAFGLLTGQRLLGLRRRFDQASA
jgi:hypothetical protein